MNISSLLSEYTNYYSSSYYSSGSASKLTTSLDTDDDGAWSYDEVSDYAADYSLATGYTLDVDSIFTAYDTNGDNSLDTGEQSAMTSADALRLDAIATAYTEESDFSDSLLSQILSDDDSASSYLISAFKSAAESLLLQYTMGLGSDDDSKSIASQAAEYWIEKNSDSSDSSSSSSKTVYDYLSSSSSSSSILDLLI